MVELLTTVEVCKLLGKSDKTVQRYVRRGFLHPQEGKSDRGTLEYRFNRKEVEAFKDRQNGKERQDIVPSRTDTTESDRPRGDMSVLSETITILQKQLEVKDGQISDLHKRLQESNILLKGMQDKLIAAPREPERTEGKTERTDRTDSVLRKAFPTIYKILGK